MVLHIDEAEVSTHYILDKIGVNKIAVVYEKGSLGEDALLGVRMACKKKTLPHL